MTIQLTRNTLFAALLFAAGCQFFGGTHAMSEETKPAENQAKLPQTLTVTCSLDSYGFTPIPNKSWSIDQHGYGLKKHELVLKRHDRRMPFGGGVPGWKGSKTIVVKDGYSVRIDAHYLIRKPLSDFILKPSGLTIDVSYLYKNKLIGYGSAAQWSEEKEISVSANATDTAYIALMNENDFEIPSQFSGYDYGFQYWAAARDGIGARGEETNFDSLSSLLKPLGRDGNLMMPIVTVHTKVTRPTGSDIPKANYREGD